MKKRVYWGCEMESPLYRQVVKEMATKRMYNEGYEATPKNKRGKRS